MSQFDSGWHIILVGYFDFVQLTRFSFRFPRLGVSLFAICERSFTRILLLASARSLFSADVYYHKNCYVAFTGGAWYKEENVKEADNKSDLPVIEIEKFFDLVENHIMCRGEVYTASQLHRCYTDMFGKSRRSIDMKVMLEDRFGDKLVYGRPVEYANNESEFVYSSSTKFPPGVIRFATTSISIQTSIMIRNFATGISHNIKLR